MAQISPKRPINDMLIERVVEYLHTRDSTLFPFMSVMNDRQKTAFARDLREALGEVNDSGSARKTSATGFMASDERLRRVIAEWQQSDGTWPEGSFPEDPITSLGSSTPEDSPGPRVYAKKLLKD